MAVFGANDVYAERTLTNAGWNNLYAAAPNDPDERFVHACRRHSH